MPRPVVIKYGLTWPANEPVKIEMKMIQKGGHFMDKDRHWHGMGLLHHYLELRKLIWPERYEHRWTRLIYENIIENSGTILMGCASSQKTGHAAEWVLLDYFCFPENTCVLVSTTSLDKLEMAVFGEIKMLYQRAKERFPWLPGNLIEGKRAIATDNIQEDDSRDLRKGVVGRACFPSGTLVDTPTGKKRIETIKVGDEVTNACGVGRVKHTMSRTADRIVRVTLSDKRTIDCTPEHPFLTQYGWKKAIDLNTCDRVLSANETMRLLRRTFRSGVSEQKTLFGRMQEQRHYSNLPVLWRFLPALEAKDGEPRQQAFLQHNLCWKMGRQSALALSSRHSMQTLRKAIDWGSHESTVLLSRMPIQTDSDTLSEMRKAVYIHSRLTKQAKERFLQFALLVELEGKEDSQNEQHTDTSRACGMETVSESSDVELSDTHWSIQDRWQEALVQGRHRLPRHKTGRGNKRWSASDSRSHPERQAEDERFDGYWVDRIDVLKPSGDARFVECEGGYRVHNLEVEGHPSYSVNGVIVHNCYVGSRFVGLGVYAGIKQERFRFLCDELQFMPPTFLGCLPNMRSNTGSGGLKVIGSGNPDHDPDSQLGIVAEPIEGWSSVDGITKTTVWPTKFFRFKCVNLIGLDSPNFEAPEGQPEPYPRLIGREFAKIIAHDYGKDSPEFETQCWGRMRMGLAKSRVITRQLCRDHHAHDPVVWLGTARTRIYALDPAYGGGDRCMTIWGEFGKDVDNKVVLFIHPPKIIPLNASNPLEIEDQIAEKVFSDLTELNIDAQNCFYDSFGKGTVGFAFARKFGMHSPVPVDSSARCSLRPVREDLFIKDSKRNERRQKRCDEHYSKFVTEMWFSVRYTIEAEQLRGLQESTMTEGCARIYYSVPGPNGDRIEVEPKEDMKERLGKSPDEFDALAILVEGARQRGFRIAKLANAESELTNTQWLSDLRDKQKGFSKEWQLNYATR